MTRPNAESPRVAVRCQMSALPSPLADRQDAHEIAEVRPPAGVRQTLGARPWPVTRPTSECVLIGAIGPRTASSIRGRFSRLRGLTSRKGRS